MKSYTKYITSIVFATIISMSVVSAPKKSEPTGISMSEIELMIRQGLLEEATNALDSASKADPKNAQIDYLIGKCHVAQNNDSSAIDAFIHAIESYVSPRANLYTEMFSMKAMEMIIEGFRAIIANGEEYRFNLLEEFLVASNLAGVAFGNAGTGIVHAMSYPLSGAYHVTHGEANYQFLTTAFAFYQEQNPDGMIKGLNEFLGKLMDCAADDVYTELEKLLDKIIARKPLHEYGMTEEEIVAFAKKDVITSSGFIFDWNLPEIDLGGDGWFWDENGGIFKL